MKKDLSSISGNPNSKTENHIEQTKTVDTASFEYFLQLTDNIIKQIPSYLINKFIGSNWNDDSDPYRKIYSEETDHYKLYDNYIVTFSVSMYGVAGQTILASYSFDGQMIDHLVVAQSSDMELSATSYSSQSFQIFDDSLVQIINQTITAKNYDYKMPDTIDLFSLDSTEVNETLKYSYYVIQRSGRFQKVIPIRPIIDKQQLKHLTKSEHLIIRNEFFARLGYTFHNPDLIEYFSKFSWYKPKYDDVTGKLTAFDLYNINMIKQIEDKK